METIWTKQEDRKLYNLVDMGLPVKQIAKMLRQPEEAVKDNLISLNLTEKQATNEANNVLIIENFNAGRSISDISHTYNIPFSYVKTILAKLPYIKPMETKKKSLPKSSNIQFFENQFIQKKELSLKDQVAIYKLYAHGQDLDMIAKELNYDVDYLKDNFHRVPGIEKMNYEFTGLVLEHYNMGKTPVQISKETGASYKRVKEVYDAIAKTETKTRKKYVNAWTEKENLKIMEMYTQGYTKKEISEVVKSRTPLAISAQIHSLKKKGLLKPLSEDQMKKLQNRNQTYWSEQELELLKTLVSKKTMYKEIVKQLPLRTLNSVTSKIHELGLKSESSTPLPKSSVINESRVEWTPERSKTVLDLHNQGLNPGQISSETGIKTSAIYKQLYKILHCTPFVVINQEESCAPEAAEIVLEETPESEAEAPIPEPFIDYSSRPSEDQILKMFKKALKSKRSFVFVSVF